MATLAELDWPGPFHSFPAGPVTDQQQKAGGQIGHPQNEGTATALA
jgi:hypothetical protein